MSDRDVQQLNRLGYKQEFRRTFKKLESFAASFCAVNILGSVRAFFYLGLSAGGPMAMWISSLLCIIFASTTAATLAEICSKIPVSGGIYNWAMEAALQSDKPMRMGGGKLTASETFARFIGITVAWWAAAGWISLPVFYVQQSATYLLSLLPLFNQSFLGGISDDNIKWRVVVWITVEAALLLSILPAYFSPLWLRRFYRFALFVMVLDALLCFIWLPIRVKDTYGFQTAKGALLTTHNGTGAPAGLNWMLSFVFAIYSVTGYDACGHVAEETMDASSTAPRGVLWGAITCSVYAFLLTIFFLFCTPDIDHLLSFRGPQLFVFVYSQALGRTGAVFMTVLAALGLICSASATIMAASRLLYAVARDGPTPLPGWVKWVKRVDSHHRPRNAVMVVYAFCATLLCAFLPSAVAFTSLLSCTTLLIIMPYGLIALLHLTVTPDKFKGSKFYLGRFRRVIYAIAVIFEGCLFAILVSPFYFPVAGQTFNFSCIVFTAITGFGAITWWHSKALLLGYVRGSENVQLRDTDE